MDTPTQRTTLANDLSMPVLAPLIQMKGLFSKHPHLTALSAFYSGLAVYEQGAVLGRARRAQMVTLAKLLAEPGRERDACDALIASAKQDVEEYDHPPERFVEFFASTIAKPFASYRDPDTLKKMAKEQVRLGQVLEWIDMWFLSGIGLGLALPELVETMWRNSYETSDRRAWQQARQAGLDIPEHDTPLSLEDMEQVVLSQVAEYAREYVPEVVEPLGLPAAGEAIQEGETDDF